MIAGPPRSTGISKDAQACGEELSRCIEVRESLTGCRVRDESCRQRDLVGRESEFALR